MKKLLLVSVAVLLLAPAVALAAGGRFTDDDESIFEDNIEWLAGAGVTLGCNPPANDRFCPNDKVSRGQMAAFMQRFARFLGAEDGVVSEAENSLTLRGQTPEELLDGSPAVISAAEFAPDGFGTFGDHIFDWVSTGLTYDGIGGNCLQAGVPLPNGATPESAEVVVLDTNGTGRYEYHSAVLGDPSSLTTSSGSAIASGNSQTVTVDITGPSTSDTTQNWIGVCLGESGDTLYGARVHYSLADTALSSSPAGLKPAAPAGGTSDNR